MEAIQTFSKYTPVLRQNGNGNYSRQPRFTEKQFSNFLTWTKKGFTEAPAYSTDSRSRDKWLLDFTRKETMLGGVLNNVTLIDANRGWSITGGRNQVYRYTGLMHEAEDGQGWRFFAKRASLAFWATDINNVVELGRDGLNGPIRAIYNVDSTRCQLTGEPDTPLAYHPLNGKMQKWQPADYFRVASMPQVEEEFYSLGFCAVSRALEFARLMYAIWEYDREKLDPRMMNGLLLLMGISEEQWDTAMDARKEGLSALEREYYGGVQVLASPANEFPIDAKLVALSELPDNFDQETMVNLLMYGYALCFGYDPREFWPVSQGSLGTGRETQVQAEKATSKGGGDWRLGFQEQFQQHLPDTIQFEFDERDDGGELLEAEMKQAKAEVINSMAEVRETSEPVLDREEIRQLYAQAGLIPEEWTEQEEDITTTDEDEARSLPAVRRACERYPDEPIIRYSYRPVVGKNGEIVAIRETEKVLYRAGREALQPRVWYAGDGWKLTQRDIERGHYQAAT